MLSWVSGSNWARWSELIVGNIVSSSPLTTRTGLSTFVRPAARLGHFPRRVIRLGDQSVVYRTLVEEAQRGHQVFFRAAPAPGVAAGHDMGFEMGHQLADLRRGGLIQTAVTAVLDDPVPVRAVRPAGPRADRRRHDRHVFGEGRHLRAGLRDGGQVRRGQAHPLQQH